MVTLLILSILLFNYFVLVFGFKLTQWWLTCFTVSTCLSSQDFFNTFKRLLLAPTEFLLNLRQRLTLGLWHQSKREQCSQETDGREYPKRYGAAERVTQETEGERHNECRSPVQSDGNTGGVAFHFRREEFPNHHPRDGTETQAEHHDEGDNGQEWQERNVGHVVLEIVLQVEVETQHAERNGHDKVRNEEQNATARFVNKDDGNAGTNDLHDAHNDGTQLGGQRAPRGREDNVGVEDNGVDA